MNKIHPGLVELAKYAGGRFDWVQAGGGNVSWKDPEGLMWIKNSGITLSELESHEQCACLKTAAVSAILEESVWGNLSDKKQREKIAKDLLEKTNLTPHKKPSIETFLHATLEAFTLHTHPIVVNQVVIQKSAKKILTDLLPKAILVDYATPGIELALCLKEEMKVYETRWGEKPEMIFLKNHGLITHGKTAEIARDLTEHAIQVLEKALHVNYAVYHFTSPIAALVRPYLSYLPVAWVSQDQCIASLWTSDKEIFSILPTSPDAFVFNGYGICILNELKAEAIEAFIEKFNMPPKVIVYRDHFYFIHRNIRKAKEMEEVFKFHLLVLKESGSAIDVLPLAELVYLSEWEAEHYRQKV